MAKGHEVHGNQTSLLLIHPATSPELAFNHLCQWPAAPPPLPKYSPLLHRQRSPNIIANGNNAGDGRMIVHVCVQPHWCIPVTKCHGDSRVLKVAFLKCHQRQSIKGLNKIGMLHRWTTQGDRPIMSKDWRNTEDELSKFCAEALYMSPWDGEQTTKQCATEVGQGVHLGDTLWSFLCLLRRLQRLRLRCGFRLPFGLRFLPWCGLLSLGRSFGLQLLVWLELVHLRKRLFAHPRHYAWYAWKGSAHTPNLHAHLCSI